MLEINELLLWQITFEHHYEQLSESLLKSRRVEGIEFIAGILFGNHVFRLHMSNTIKAGLSN